MKKVILLLLATIMLQSVYATDVVVDSTSQTTSKMVYQDGKDFFKSLATTTKDGISTGYDIIVQQQRVYAIQYIIVGVLCLLFGWLFIKFYRKTFDETTKSKNMLFPSIVFLIMAIWTGIVFSLHYSQVVQGLVNPDFAAIKDIVAMFVELKK